MNRRWLIFDNVCVIMQSMEASRAPDSPYTDDDLVARRVDQGVGNYAIARFSEDVSSDLPPTYPNRPTAARRRPSGRPAVERRDSELDPNWNVDVIAGTPEERARVVAGVAGVRAALRASNAERLAVEGESESDRILRLARERARDEKRQKQLERGW